MSKTRLAGLFRSRKWSLLVQKKLLKHWLQEISRRSSGSRNPTSPINLSLAPTAPVEEPVAPPQPQSFVARQQLTQAPEFVAAPLKLQSLLQRQLLQHQLLLQKNQQQLQFRTGPSSCSSEWTSFNKLHSKPTNNLLKQLINKLLTKVNQDNLILANQVSTVGSRWWLPGGSFQLQASTAVENSKALNRPHRINFDCRFVLTYQLSSQLSGATGGYGMDFRAFMLTLISLFFSIFKQQDSLFVVWFFKIRNTVMVVHFEEFGRCLYTLPLALLAFLVDACKVYEFYGFVNFLIFFLFFVGTCYIVHQEVEQDSFLKQMKFFASSGIICCLASHCHLCHFM